MERVLVLGGNGFLGSTIRSKIRGEHYWHARSSTGVEKDAASLIVADLQSQLDIENLLNNTKIDVIINCLALTNIEYCEQNKEEAYWVNSTIPKIIANYCAKKDVALYHFSTDAVYANSPRDSKEDEQLEPKSVYGLSKALGEQNVVSELRSAIILRTNFVGLNSKGVGLLNFFTSNLVAHNPVSGFADVQFNTVEVNQLASKFLQIYRNLLPGIYNFTGSEKFTKYEFGLLVAEILNSNQTLVRKAFISDTRLSLTRNSNQVMCTKKISSLGVSFPGLKFQLQEILAANLDKNRGLK
jgi:dTDP-4-dehydrorhamnose reductase